MSDPLTHATTAELTAGLAYVTQSPKHVGVLDSIVRRPATGHREMLAEGELSTSAGLVGDTWNARSSKRTADGSPHPEMQLTLMNVRTLALVAGPRDRWPLAGDQLYVDLDLSTANLPAGTRLALGDTAVLEVTTQPHTGCSKFVERFGAAAMAWVNSPIGKELRLRGVYARVVTPGTVRPGDGITVMEGGHRG